MTDTFTGIALIGLGVALALRRDRFARLVIEQQNRAWGFRFDRAALTGTAWVCLAVAAGFVALGGLLAAGAIQARR